LDLSDNYTLQEEYMSIGPMSSRFLA
jgi:hypothetical protein